MSSLSFPRKLWGKTPNKCESVAVTVTAMPRLPRYSLAAGGDAAHTSHSQSLSHAYTCFAFFRLTDFRGKERLLAVEGHMGDLLPYRTCHLLLAKQGYLDNNTMQRCRVNDPSLRIATNTFRFCQLQVTLSQGHFTVSNHHLAANERLTNCSKDGSRPNTEIHIDYYMLLLFSITRGL